MTIIEPHKQGDPIETRRSKIKKTAFYKVINVAVFYAFCKQPTSLLKGVK